MIGKLIGTCIVLFLCSFVIGTVLMIFKDVLTRRKRAASEANKTDEKEVDQSNSDPVPPSDEGKDQK